MANDGTHQIPKGNLHANMDLTRCVVSHNYFASIKLGCEIGQRLYDFTHILLHFSLHNKN